MRQVVLDTETTGLEIRLGHRVIELGCVELVNRRRTSRTLHHYLQPDRDIDPGAQEVHGISIDMLQGKPRFGEIAEDFLEFIAGAELVIHNAEFDVGFLNAELGRTGRQPATVTEICTVVDTLALARRLHPGQRNSLDALCKRYSIDNSGREYHGALLDAHLLADVYLAMTGGQATLSLDRSSLETGGQSSVPRGIDRAGLALRVIRATAGELLEHEQQLQLIDKASKGKTLWRSCP
ncbi:MAG: DNA polymerase III subunit epsilon [Gammaproteobacteria bacterium]|nr:DNA polymerase III subunit epsilon [Gammaproteobacteria bacterium]